jgi:ATP-binding cassette subfamily F protein 2
VALAKALFIRPSLLLLDEPTNHLDLEACVWLENYLSTYDRCLVLVSHSQDFLNGVCTDIMHITEKKQLQNYTGNYDQFIITKKENEVQQMKQYEKQQDDIDKVLISHHSFLFLYPRPRTNSIIPFFPYIS